MILLLGIALLPAVMAIGCPNCLGYDKSAITSTCHTACADPNYGFTEQDQIKNCQEYCDTFAIKENCCNTVTCPSDPFTCTHPQSIASRDTESTDAAMAELEKLKRDPSLLDVSRLVSRSWPYDQIESTEQLRSLNPRALAHWRLQGSDVGRPQRRSNADICCKVAKGMTYGAVALLPNARNTEDDWYALVVLMSIGIAAAQTCAKLFSMVCNTFPLQLPTGAAPAVPPALALA